jgi:hypothetical protein
MPEINPLDPLGLLSVSDVRAGEGQPDDSSEIVLPDGVQPEGLPAGFLNRASENDLRMHARCVADNEPCYDNQCPAGRNHGY